MSQDRSQAPADLLIEGGRVLDGTGAAALDADLAIADGRIAAILPRHPRSNGGHDFMARETLDARGLVVAPGFIDVHTHDDRAVLATPDMTAKISQGVTTVIGGNCGVSLAPLDPDREPPPPMNLIGNRGDYRYPRLTDYADALAADPPAVNIALLIGHSTLRLGAMDSLDRAASESEIGAMAETLEGALEDGALGLSTGLAYPTAMAAPTEEVIALAKHLAPHGALHTTHMRDEGGGLLDSVEETLQIGREAGVRSVISHHKAAGRENWGSTAESLAKVAEARRSQAIDLDVYPYTASSTVLIADWVEKCDKVLIAWSEPHPELAGRDLAEIAAEWSCDRQAAVERLQPAGAIYFQMDEADLRRVLAFPRAMIGSDGLPHDSRPHPRLWGTFPRVLGHYCRELGLFSLEEAVHRMTGLAAEIFGFADRGRIAVGAVADLVLFDPERVIDRADYQDPDRPASGIARVLVAGQAVWDGEAETGARPGRFLPRGG